MRTTQRAEKDSIDLIYPHPCRVIMIDQLSDFIADRRIAETGHKCDNSMSLGIKISKKQKT